MSKIREVTQDLTKAIRKTNWLEKALEPVTILTVAIVIVSSLQWLVMSHSDETMRHQVAVMEQQTAVMQGQIQEMKSEQRPWVYTTVAITDDLILDAKPYPTLHLGFTFQNIGHLPALHVFPLVRVKFAKISDQDENTLEQCSELEKGLFANAGRYVFPGQGFSPCVR